MHHPDATPERLIPRSERPAATPERPLGFSDVGRRVCGCVVLAGLSFAAVAVAGGSGADADSHTGGGGDSTAVQPGEVLEVAVAGQDGVPAGAVHAYMNLTVGAAQGAGFLSVVDCGNPQPNTSIINYDAGTNSTRANNAVVRLDDDGKVCLMPSQGATHVLVDVTAVDSGDDPLLHTPDEPIRVDDSRTDEVVLAGEERRVKVAGVDGVPDDVRIVMVALTATQPNRPGYVSAKACDGQPADTSSVNFKAQENGATTVLVALDEHGQFCVGASQSDVHVLADVMAWTTDPDSPIETFDSPRRVDDSRPDGQVIAYGQRPVAVAGEQGIPDDAAVVFANVTGVSGTATYMSVGECGRTDTPTSSLLNMNGGPALDAKANGAIISLGADGGFCIYGGNGPDNTGVLDSMVDVAGYIRAGAASDGFHAFQDPIRVADTRNPPDNRELFEITVYYKPPRDIVDPEDGSVHSVDYIRYGLASDGVDFDTYCFMEVDHFTSFPYSVVYTPHDRCPVPAPSIDHPVPGMQVEPGYNNVRQFEYYHFETPWPFESPHDVYPPENTYMALDVFAGGGRSDPASFCKIAHDTSGDGVADSVELLMPKTCSIDRFFGPFP